jgi:glycosyltransferase involved in cell wall biosynthesis
MNILQVIPYFTPRRGGDVHVCAMLSRILAKRGHDVTILTTDFEYDGEYAQSCMQGGVTVIPVPSTRMRVGLFIHTPRMKTWLEDNLDRYDLVHLHDYRNYQNIVASRIARKKNIPYVLQAHGDIPYFDKYARKIAFDRVWGRAVLGSARRVLALTPKEADDYGAHGVGRDRIELVPNGIDLSAFRNLPVKGEFKRKHALTEEQQMVLYLGRLHPSKGIGLLLDAFRDISRRDGQVTLVIIGADDGFGSEIAAYIKKHHLENRILVLGFVSTEEKIMAYVDADVFVTPRFYGLPVTFLEACACGTPLVTTDDGDRIDWVSRAGLCVEYTPEALGNAMGAILGDPVLRETFSREGKALATTVFNWESIITRLETIYAAVTVP